MDRGFDIPWVGDKIISIGDQNTMGRGSIFHGYGGQNTMGRGVTIPWMDSIYHG